MAVYIPYLAVMKMDNPRRALVAVMLGTTALALLVRRRSQLSAKLIGIIGTCVAICLVIYRSFFASAGPDLEAINASATALSEILE